GKMKGGAGLSEGHGGMEDLLHSLLVYDCDHDDERFRLAQKVRNSDECRELAKAIADAQVENSTGKARLSSHAQNGASSAQDVKSKSTADASLGRKWQYPLSESQLTSLGEREKLKSELEHDGAKNLKVYTGVWQVVGSLGKTIVREQ